MEIKRVKVVISKKAQESIKHIFEYLKIEVSFKTASKVKTEILKKCKSLEDFAGYSKDPYLEDLDGDFRSVTQWNYVIIYRKTSKEVRVLNVIHSSMHPENRKNI